MPELEKNYDPKANEERIYKIWEESGFFNPDNLPVTQYALRNTPFSMVLPPPNVTGILHMGHAAMVAIQDILVRYHRMKGDRTLWIPGTDHAAIATQEKVERELYKKEKKTRHDLGRENFLQHVEQFAAESKATIINQIKHMGASLDWSREAFTLDEMRTHAVFEAFKRMFEAGLIYRGNRIVNWDPKLQTTVSDDEIEWKEEKAPFYYLKYGPFVIATARPETKFGDKYVVMHPDDRRYVSYKHGQKIELEWINGRVSATIIKDPVVDMTFGTGVMTITPAHDMADFEIAQRHKLDIEQIIDLKGKLLPIAGEFAGEHISKARPKIVEKLKAKGLLEKIDEKYLHNVATDSRGGGVIEPQILKQWFVDVNKKFKVKESEIPGVATGSELSLKEMMRKAVEGGGVKIVPERFEKIYYHWIDNLRDWCISRQIWYGHRIPVWYRAKGASSKFKVQSSKVEAEDQEIYIGIESPEGEGWAQDPDTLDTWFSSGLWTLSTLGWPDQTEDLKIFHPTSVLETGYDIIFFWVARMILMTGFLAGQVPFKNVYLHGLVRDEKGQKMSKSLGNIIDPLEMAEKYGADATRLSLIIGTAPGNDQKLSENKVKGYKHFANKIWNISRFVMMNLEGMVPVSKPKMTEKDEAALKGFETIKKEVTAHIEAFEFHAAAEKAYHYVWHEFADKVIEESKAALQGPDSEKQSAQYMLFAILTGSLKLLHPFMPFVTETIWEKLPASPATSLAVRLGSTESRRESRRASQGGPIPNKKLLMVSEW